MKRVDGGSNNETQIRLYFLGWYNGAVRHPEDVMAYIYTHPCISNRIMLSGILPQWFQACLSCKFLCENLFEHDFSLAGIDKLGKHDTGCFLT